MNPRAALGRWGEDYTANYLVKNGYVILERNWHCRFGEIDLIAQKGEILAFVEVKTRRLGSLTTPEEAITAAKRHKLYLSAECYLQSCPETLQPRFDVAAVTARSRGGITPERFDYYESAFEE